MVRRRRTVEEEDIILETIEVVANDLSKQVGELQQFLKELKLIRHPEVIQDSSNGNGIKQGELWLMKRQQNM